MAPTTQAIRNQEILKTEYSEKAAIGALYARQSIKKKDSISVESQLAYCRYETHGEKSNGLLSTNSTVSAVPF